MAHAEVLTKELAVAKWQWGCPAIERKGRWERDGNWLPLSQLLRHRDCDAAQVTVVAQDGATILTIQPKAVEPPPGKSAFVRPAFSLLVR